MSNTTKSLNEIFDVPTEVAVDDISFTTPTVIGSPQKARPLSEVSHHFERPDEVENQETDFNLVRKNMREIVEKGNRILDGIMSVANDTDKPSAYEAAGVIMKNLVEANEKLLDIHKKHKEFRKPDSEDGSTNMTGGVNVEKAVFIGSAADLLKELNKIENGERK